MKIRLNNQLLTINILAILLIIASTFFPLDVLRVILGLPFLLFFPGYTLLAAIFPRRNVVDSIERIVLSFVLSIAVVPLIGLVIAYTPFGIEIYTILISVTILIIVASIVAWYRQRRITQGEELTVSLDLSLFLWRGQSSADKILYIILTVAILGAIGTLGYVVTTPRVGEKYSEFYIQELEGKAINYTEELVLGEAEQIMVGIINREHEDVYYRLQIESSGTLIKELGPVMLGHEQKWEREVSIILMKGGENQRVELLLFKDGEDEPYRSLHIWVNVREKR
ncbi:DUF1616 domain-containing protein [Chloroflexota bacterium]